MKSSRKSVWTQTERKPVKRGIVVAGVVFAVLVVGILAQVVTGNGSRRDGGTAPLASMLEPSTNALSSAPAASEHANETYSAIVPFSEENQLFDNFQAATGESGFTSPPHASVKSATGRDQRTIRTIR